MGFEKLPNAEQFDALNKKIGNGVVRVTEPDSLNPGDIWLRPINALITDVGIEFNGTDSKSFANDSHIDFLKNNVSNELTFDLVFTLHESADQDLLFGFIKGEEDKRYIAAVRQGSTNYQFYITTDDGNNQGKTTSIEQETEVKTRITITVDVENDKIKVYKDGEETDSFNGFGGSGINLYMSELAHFSISFDAETSDRHSNMTLHEFRVFNKALSETEVKEYGGIELIGDEDGLINYYRITEENGVYINDKTSNKHNMFVKNIDWKADY